MSWEKIVPQVPRGAVPEPFALIRTGGEIAFSGAAQPLLPEIDIISADLFFNSTLNAIGVKFFPDESGVIRFQKNKRLCARAYLREIANLSEIGGKRYRVKRGSGDVHLVILLKEEVPKRPVAPVEAEQPDYFGIAPMIAKRILADHAGGADKKQLVDGYPAVPPGKIEQLLSANSKAKVGAKA